MAVQLGVERFASAMTIDQLLSLFFDLALDSLSSLLVRLSRLFKLSELALNDLFDEELLVRDGLDCLLSFFVRIYNTRNVLLLQFCELDLAFSSLT